ncbi:MAG: CdaR family protein [Desulfobulbaceae bacterium]|jgi:YbbR domain-containing protein|nr:CdaR family protein [Desulfobulbaceae bacterium]
MKKIRLFRNKPDNWMLKVVSLCLAVMLWYFVVGEDQVDINMQVPIEIINLPKDLIISNQYKSEIEVSIRGPRSMIQDIRNRNITRPVDLSTAKPGTIVIRNDEQSVPFPKGVTVQRLQPTNITLQLDQLVQKKFPIKAVTEGKPAKGYELQQIQLDPDHLVISGPKTVLEKGYEISTYVIDLDGLNHTTTMQVNLNLEPDLFELLGETVVSARLEVREVMEERTVKNILVNARDAQVPVAVKPDSVTVRAAIPVNLIKETPELSMLFRASASVKDGEWPQTVKVNVTGVAVPGHDPVKIIEVKPPEVVVTAADGPKDLEE